MSLAVTGPRLRSQKGDGNHTTGKGGQNVELTDAQIGHFVNSHLKLAKEQRKGYLEQVDRLIEKFTGVAKDDSVIDIRKFLKTGSLRKGTVLCPRGDHGVDADIAVYLNTDGTSATDLATLHTRIRRLLVKTYPQMDPSQFTVQPRTLGIEFKVSGLAVDLVPIIPIDGQGDYGWQPSSQGEAPVKTSVPVQLEFIRTHKESDRRFRSIVRLLKHWRNHQELDELRSYTIELIVAHLQDTHGPAGTLEEGLLRFFLYVAQNELRDVIKSGGEYKARSGVAARVVILDPANNENNVARRLTDDDCREIIEKSREAWERISEARNNNYKIATIECWKDVFGRSFAIED